MATTIKLKNGSGAPLASDLVQGEVALDLTNKRIYSENSSGTVIEMGTSPSTIDINAGTVDGISSLSTANGTDVSFAGVSATKLFWDASAESLGIGTTSPSSPLHVSSTTYPQTKITNAISFNVGVDSSNNYVVDPVSGSTRNVVFNNSGAGSLNVGIGTSNPAVPLHVAGETRIYPASGTAVLRFGENTTEKGKLSVDNTSNMVFETANVERMRIDSSGNLLVGTTDTLGTTAGFKALSTGLTRAVRASDVALAVSRLTTDGDIAVFQKDGTTVGSIGTTSSQLYIGTGDAGIFLNSSSDTIQPYNTTTTTVRDALLDLGSSGARWKNLYLSGGAASGTSSNFLRFLHDGSNGIIDNTLGSLVFRRSGFAESMRIDSSGNVGIGVAPSSSWHSTYVDALQLGNVGSAIWASTNSYSANNYLFFSNNTVYDGTNDLYARTAPALQATLGNNEFRWNQAPSGTAGNPITWTRAMTLDSSGNLLVGTTDANPGNNSGGTDVGIVLRGATGDFYASAVGACSILNRQSTDGDIEVFKKDGTVVGSIGSEGGDSLVIQSGTTSGSGLLFHPSAGNVNPARNGAKIDNAIDLGRSTHRFKDLYLSGGVYLGGTGAANKLDDYEEGTWTGNIVTGTSGTITKNTATDLLSYTKVGRLVTITGRISVSSVSSPVGTFIGITTLPFTPSPATEAESRTSGAGAYYNGTSTTLVLMSTSPNNATLFFTLDASGVSGGDYFQFTFTYYTTA